MADVGMKTHLGRPEEDIAMCGIYIPHLTTDNPTEVTCVRCGEMYALNVKWYWHMRGEDMNADAILADIARQKQKLDDTRTGLPHGTTRDAMKLAIPMVEDTLATMTEVVKLVKNLEEQIKQNHSDMQSRTDPRLYGGQ